MEREKLCSRHCWQIFSIPGRNYRIYGVNCVWMLTHSFSSMLCTVTYMWCVCVSVYHYKLMSVFFHTCFFFCLWGNLGQAELIGREALRLLPNDHTIMFSLANVLGKLQKYKVSQRCINISTQNIVVFLGCRWLYCLQVLPVSAISEEWYISNSVFLFFLLRSQRASSCALFGSTQKPLVAMAI